MNIKRFFIGLGLLLFIFTTNGCIGFTPPLEKQINQQKEKAAKQDKEIQEMKKIIQELKRSRIEVPPGVPKNLTDLKKRLNSNGYGNPKESFNTFVANGVPYAFTTQIRQDGDYVNFLLEVKHDTYVNFTYQKPACPCSGATQ